MTGWKPLKGLVPLGLCALTGLSACCICPLHRVPQVVPGTAPQAAVTSSPPVAAPAETGGTATHPAQEPIATPDVSAPGPLPAKPIDPPDSTVTPGLDVAPGGRSPGSSGQPMPGSPGGAPALPDPAPSGGANLPETAPPAAGR